MKAKTIVRSACPRLATFFKGGVFVLNLQSMVLGNSVQDWLTALTIALIINLLVGLIKWAVIFRLAKILKKTETALDDSLIEVARRTRQWLVFAVTLYIGVSLSRAAAEAGQHLENDRDGRGIRADRFVGWHRAGFLGWPSAPARLDRGCRRRHQYCGAEFLGRTC